MKLFILLLVVFSLTILTSASSEKIVKETIASEGKTRAYYLFVPDSVKPGKPVPLIILLHGSGRNGLSLVEKWKELANKEGIVIVGPDAGNTQGWSIPADGPTFMRDLTESLKSRYPINPRRVYLFGHSAGAGFALYMSVLESEYFAATAIHAGALREKDAPLIEQAKRKIPISIFVGTKDPFVPLDAVRATREMLNAQGFKTELTEMPGHDHWYYDLAPKINLSAWEFLKQHELSTDPQYEEYR